MPARAAPSLAERPRLRLFVLCALYVAQGIPWGFTAVALPVYLGARGVDPAEIGRIGAMTVLPYTFKWVWGPIIDAFTIRRFGRRRPWIILAQAMMALSLGVLLGVSDPGADLELLAMIVFVHTIFNALQDVAVDGLAVDLLTDAERGRANGLMYASKWGGGAVGGGGLAKVTELLGMRAALVIMVVILLAIMILPIAVRERATPPPARPSLLGLVGSLARAFSLRSTILCAILMAGANLAVGVLTIASTVLYTQTLGWSPATLASLSGGVGLVVGGLAAAAGGFIASALGTRRTAALAGLVIAGGWAAFAAVEPRWGSYELALVFVVVEQVGVAVFTVALITLSMAVAWPRVGASQFAAYMALSSVGTATGYRLAGDALETFTYPGLYLVAAAYQVGILVLLPFIDPTQTRRALPADAPAQSV